MTLEIGCTKDQLSKMCKTEGIISWGASINDVRTEGEGSQKIGTQNLLRNST